MPVNTCIFRFFVAGTFFLAFLVFLAAPAAVLAGDKEKEQERKPHIVFLISKDPLNYKADVTIPPFADSLQRTGLYKTTVLLGRGPHAAFELDGLEALQSADLLVVFCRRIALPHQQMRMIRSYMEAGKPVIGIRTANHGFSVRGENAKPGYEGWWGFVPDILGCENQGYEDEALGTVVKRNNEQQQHPILSGIPASIGKWEGQVYKVAPLIDPEAVVLRTGSTEEVTEPAAWARRNHYGGKVFYTSLGYPTNFGQPVFRQLLVNAIQWAVR